MMENQLNNDPEEITPRIIPDQGNERDNFNEEDKAVSADNEPHSGDDLPDDEAANEDNSLENEPLDEEI